MGPGTLQTHLHDQAMRIRAGYRFRCKEETQLQGQAVRDGASCPAQAWFHLASQRFL